MKKWNALFKKFGYCAKFRSARNKVIGMLRKAKADYFKNFNPRDSKFFWKTVKCLNKQQSITPTLQQGEVTAHSDMDKAEILNNFFPHISIVLSPPSSISS